MSGWFGMTPPMFCGVVMVRLSCMKCTRQVDGYNVFVDPDEAVYLKEKAWLDLGHCPSTPSNGPMAAAPD